MEALFLGIDVGTTTVKAALFDANGHELRVAGQNTEPCCSPNGQTLQNMYEIWDSVAGIIREVISDSQKLGTLMGIGVTGMGDGLWLVDEKGRPVTDATLWTDGRAGMYINKWKAEGVIGQSGRVAFAGSPLPLSAWYYEHQPQVMASASRMMFCKDWIKYCLTGEIVTDATDLSDASVIEVWSRNYSQELLDKFGVPQLMDLLPPIRPCTDIIGRVTKEAAQKTGLPEGLPVVNGMIDVVSSAVGNGVVEPLHACTIIGTTVYNEMVLDCIEDLNLSQENAPSIICYARDNRWLLTMGTMLGTPNLDWFLREFYQGQSRCPTFAELEEQLIKLPPGAEGIIFHPYLGEGGERAPFVKPSAAAQFFGIKSHHTREHMLLAVYEGIAYSMKDCYQHFPLQPKAIRLCGGGSASAFWCRMFANCVGMPVQVTHGNQIGALGAAMVAAVGVGYFDTFHQATERMIRIRETYEPDPRAVRVYEDYYGLYRRLVDNVWDLWDAREKLCKAN